MMMKKTTSALAVAALLGTGAASAATFQVNDDTSFDVYAGIYMTYKDQTQDDGTDKTTLLDNGSDVIFSGETTVDGMTVFGVVDLTTGGTADKGTVSTSDASAGVSGEFGQIEFGRLGGVTQGYDGAVRDTDETANVYSPGSFDVDGAVRYSNSVANVSYVLQAQTEGDLDGSGAAQESGTSLGASFSADLGGITLQAGYDARSNTAADEPIYGAAVTTMLGGANVGAYFERDDAATTEADIFGLGADFNYGGGTIYGVFQTVDFASVSVANTGFGTSTNLEVDDSFTQSLIGVNYNIAPNMYVYGEYLTLDRVKDQGDTVSMGAVAYF